MNSFPPRRNAASPFIWGMPVPDESPFGYRLRLAEANGYPSIQFIPHPKRGKSYFSSKISKDMGDDIDLASKIRNGEYISQKFLDHVNCKICPICLKDRRIIPFYWDLIYWTVCPVHSCKLISSCPKCGSRLSWRRAHMGHCCEELPFHTCDPQPASPTAIALSRCFAMQVDLDSPPPSKELSDLTKDLGISRISRLISILGRLNSGDTGGRKIWPEQATIMQAKAADILEHWPGSFHYEVLLNKLGELNQSLPTDHRLYNRTRSLLYRTVQDLPIVYGEFLKASKMLDIHKYLSDYSASYDRSDRHMVPIRHAANACGVGLHKLRRLMKVRGFQPHLFTLGCRTFNYVRGKELRMLLESLSEEAKARVLSESCKSVNVSQASKILGLPPPYCKNILKSSVLGGQLDRGVRPQVNRSLLNDILTRFSELANKASFWNGREKPRMGLTNVVGLAKIFHAEIVDVVGVIFRNELHVSCIDPTRVGIQSYLFDTQIFIDTLKAERSIKFSDRLDTRWVIPFPELENILGISAPTLRNLVDSPLIRGTVVGVQKYIDIDDLTNLLRRFDQLPVIRTEATHPLKNLQKLTWIFKSTIANMMALILDQNLAVRAIDSSGIGLLQYLFDPDDFSVFFQGTESRTNTVNHAGALLKTDVVQ